MIALIEDNREAITELCERHGVRRVAVFGLIVFLTGNQALRFWTGCCGAR